MSQEATMMLVLLGGGLALALLGRWSDAKVLRRMRPENVGSLGGHEKRAIRDGLFQRKMFEDGLSGLIHLLLVVGSLCLVPRAVTLVGEAFGVQAAGMFGKQGALGVYALFLDAGALALVLGSGLGLFRRWMMRPKHLRPSLQADVILSAMGFWGLSNALLEGVRVVGVYGMAESSELPQMLSAFGPVGLFLGDVFRAAGMEDNSGELGRMLYWSACGVMVFLIAAVPRTRLRHIWMSFRALMHSTHLPGHAIAVVPQTETVESWGKSQFGHLRQKAGVDLLACTACGRCERACPTALSDMELRPGEIQARGVHGLQANGGPLIKGQEAAGSLLQWVGEKALWQCTTCRACEESCPVGIQHVGRYVDLRRHVVGSGGSVPEELAAAFEGMKERSNPQGLPRGQRGAWAEAAGAQRFSMQNRPEYLLFLGCKAGFGGESEKTGLAVVRLLKAAGVSFGVLGPEEGCCGDTALRGGNEALFRELAWANMKTFQAYGISKVITFCPHGYQVLKNEYSQLGCELQVEHHTEVLARALSQGALKPQHEVKSRVVVHDACYLGRYNGLYEPVRALLDGVPGTMRVEIRESQGDAVCCGGGGGGGFLAGQRQLLGLQRWTQLCEARADVVITGCPMCRDVLGEAKGRSRVGGEIRDIAEVVAESVFGSSTM